MVRKYIENGQFPHFIDLLLKSPFYNNTPVLNYSSQLFSSHLPSLWSYVHLPTVIVWLKKDIQRNRVAIPSAHQRSSIGSSSSSECTLCSWSNSSAKCSYLERIESTLILHLQRFIRCSDPTLTYHSHHRTEARDPLPCRDHIDRQWTVWGWPK